MDQTVSFPAARVRLRSGTSLELSSWPGRGLPVVLLHEGLGSVRMWRDFPGALAAATGRPVFAWSRRGYGWSDRLEEAFEPDYMHLEAALVFEALDDLAIGRAVLFGHSDGGSIALIAAALQPDRVAGLILEAPHVMVEQVTVDNIAAVREPFENGGLRQALGKYHRDVQTMFWRWNGIWLDPRFREWSIEPLLPRVKAPTLLIQGRDDEYGSMAQLDRIEETLFDVERLEMDACGHSPHRDRPAEVLEASTAFLRRLPDAA
jgi:pimeloyl-ACP methyl ester carboxylesterase